GQSTSFARGSDGFIASAMIGSTARRSDTCSIEAKKAPAIGAMRACLSAAMPDRSDRGVSADHRRHQRHHLARAVERHGENRAQETQRCHLEKEFGEENQQRAGRRHAGFREHEKTRRFRSRSRRRDGRAEVTAQAYAQRGVEAQRNPQRRATPVDLDRSRQDLGEDRSQRERMRGERNGRRRTRLDPSGPEDVPGNPESRGERYRHEQPSTGAHRAREYSSDDIRRAPGYGLASPLIILHRMRLNSASSARSSKRRSSSADSRASRVPDGLSSARFTDGVSAAYGRTSGAPTKISVTGRPK